VLSVFSIVVLNLEVIMSGSINRRSFLHLGAAASAAALAPRWILAQAAPTADRLAQMRAAGASTPIKTTKLYDNIWLLQGAGGNMAIQSGKDGNILIDSSFATAVPHIREAITAVSTDAPHALINTHWHVDHVDGNEGMHAAGFLVIAHEKTKERMSQPAEMKLFHMSLPAYPASALPATTFATSMHHNHNGDSIDLIHYDPAHTDTDIYIHFHNADVLHCGDVFFNKSYPFIDEGTGGSIGGTIDAAQKSLGLAGDSTKIIPGHGPLGNKTDLKSYLDMLSTVREKVAALKKSGASEQEVLAKKPTADLDAQWAHGGSPDMFVGIVYRTV
jgi:glyoxylase-like metal-dependent hydrolase (beta-lactamase superfamily II)